MCKGFWGRCGAAQTHIIDMLQRGTKPLRKNPGGGVSRPKSDFRGQRRPSGADRCRVQSGKAGTPNFSAGGHGRPASVVLFRRMPGDDSARKSGSKPGSLSEDLFLYVAGLFGGAFFRGPGGPGKAGDLPGPPGPRRSGHPKAWPRTGKQQFSACLGLFRQGFVTAETLVVLGGVWAGPGGRETFLRGGGAKPPDLVK